MKDAAKLLRGLVRLSDKEGRDGFRVTLDYDNTHDGARVLDANGHVLGECYDQTKYPDEQFIEAIRTATGAAREDETMCTTESKAVGFLVVLLDDGVVPLSFTTDRAVAAAAVACQNAAQKKRRIRNRVYAEVQEIEILAAPLAPKEAY